MIRLSARGGWAWSLLAALDAVSRRSRRFLVVMTMTISKLTAGFPWSHHDGKPHVSMNREGEGPSSPPKVGGISGRAKEAAGVVRG